MTERQPGRQPQGISRTRPAAAASGSASVRRNLFQLRRAPHTPSASESALRLDTDGLSETSDIVVRNKNGELELEDPPTPVVTDQNEVVLDSRQQNEKERQRLADVVKQNQLTAPPEEVMEAVRASLRAKVAALADDNWMFEPEEAPRHN